VVQQFLRRRAREWLQAGLGSIWLVGEPNPESYCASIRGGLPQLWPSNQIMKTLIARTLLPCALAAGMPLLVAFAGPGRAGHGKEGAAETALPARVSALLA